eukprot:1188989-Prorocentrum_minimum.AAC.2
MAVCGRRCVNWGVSSGCRCRCRWVCCCWVLGLESRRPRGVAPAGPKNHSTFGSSRPSSGNLKGALNDSHARTRDRARWLDCFDGLTPTGWLRLGFNGGNMLSESTLRLAAIGQLGGRFKLVVEWRCCMVNDETSGESQ